MPSPSRHFRRGSIYMAVLSAALIVTVIGLSSITVVRVQRRAAEGTSDFSQARLYAQSAIEMGLLRIDGDANWRNTYPDGAWATDVPIGRGTYTLEGSDPTDGDLKDNNADPLVLTGIGKQGQARFKLQVRLTPQTDPLTCLEVALHSGTDLIFNGAVVTGDQILSANNSVIASGASVGPDVEAVVAVSGGTYLGKQTPGIKPRSMPDPVKVFDYYLTNGTVIPWSSIPVKQNKTQLTLVVLSPASNPFGPTNDEGIYVIDCQSRELIIKDCRIVGTLVLLNSGAATSVQGSINWTPAVANFPALLVKGDIDLMWNAAALDEGSLRVNFNPPGTPDAKGTTDLDQSDSYPSEIAGLIYVSNALNNSANDPTIRGCVVAGNSVTAAGAPKFFYDNTYLNNPPYGFEGGPRTIVISPGSWRQVVD